MQASHCRPVSDWVSSPFCRNSSSVERISSPAGMADHLTAVSIGGISPDVGSRRITTPLKIVPRPMTT